MLACSICYLGSLLASGLLDSTPCSVKIYNVRGRHPAQQHIRHSWALLFFYWARLTFVLFMPHYRHLPVWRYNTTKQHLVLLSLSYILFSVFFCCFFFILFHLLLKFHSILPFLLLHLLFSSFPSSRIFYLHFLNGCNSLHCPQGTNVRWTIKKN